MAANIFYGGSLFFIIVFVALTVHYHFYIVNTSTDSEGLTESVTRGKHLWETHGCINCHTLHGEGAYFAPEVGNVMTRWGVIDDPEGPFYSMPCGAGSASPSPFPLTLDGFPS